MPDWSEEERAKLLGKPNDSGMSPEQEEENDPRPIYDDETVIAARKAARRSLYGDAERPDIEIDENGKVTTPQEPLSWSNVGQRMAEAPADWMRAHGHVQGYDQQSVNDLKVARARNTVDMTAIPLADRAKSASPWMRAMDYALKMNDRARNPKPRDITSFERSDSEDMPVRKYTKEDIDRVKKAIANASK